MRASLFMGLVCALSLVGCDSDDDDGGADKDAGGSGSGSPDAAADAGKPPQFEVATYNAGLLDSVDYVAIRAPLVTEALAELDVDLTCVQEVWQQEHWDALVEANEDVRPHVLRPDPMPGVQGKCTPTEFAPIRTCAEEHCADVDASNLVGCTADNCVVEVGAASSSCIACLLDEGPTGDFDVIEDSCVGASAAMAGESLPPEERAYAASGSFGIGLLSRYPLMETDILVLDASAVRRGIMYARIDVPELGEISVFCGHLTPDLISAGYEGSYGSWAEENAEHVKALISWVDEKTSAGDAVMVLGDLNTGPDGEDFDGELPESYAQLPAAGFDDPYVEDPDAQCTFCADNALVFAGDTGVDSIIDHVLVKDVGGNVAVERIFTDEVPIDASSTDAGTDLPDALPRSDHYGLHAVIRPSSSQSRSASD